MPLTSFDIVLHFLLFATAIATPLVLFYLTLQIRDEKFRGIVLIYAFSFLFSALRWAGGSMASMDYAFTDADWFQWSWFLAGVISAILAIYATIELSFFLKERESMFLGRT